MTTQELARPAARLSDVLFETPRRTFAGLAHLPSNVKAIETALLFSTGRYRFGALIGPSGWGKSHILEAVAYSIRKGTGQNAEIFSAVEYALGVRAESQPAILLLDNVQDALESPRTRQQLRLALERRVRGGRQTLLSFTAPRMTRQIRSMLPNSNEWEAGLIREPAPEERRVILSQMCEAESIQLAPGLARLIASRMRGNGRTMSGALKRLRLHGSNWTDPQDILRACGAIDPFFADSSAWDLREHVYKCAENFERCPTMTAVELAVFTLMKRAHLSEEHVADYFKMEPANVYLLTMRFERELLARPICAKGLDKFIGTVVESLLTD